jgi:isopentenyl diphosphate isomerase/L-lactate dehydrogenase-like FMN-dependent dehydrogenase
VVPPHLKAGTLLKYAWKEPKTLDENAAALRDCYGLIQNREVTNATDKRAFSFMDFIYLRSLMRSDMKLVVKGIMCAEDALAAAKAGADAIWVSSGGNLKSAHQASTIQVLKSIAIAVRNSHHSNVEIFLSDGVRRGTDVVKALAYGATAVFVQRPIMWGLVKGGEEGVKALLEMLNEELKLAMALTHNFKLHEITERKVIHFVRAKL